MCTNNSASLEVSYQHLAKVQSLLAIWLTDVPREMLQIFDEVLQAVVLQSIPNYSKIAHEMHVRIIELPLSDKLRDLRQGDLNNLVRVSGVVTRRTGVFPQLLSIAYDCVNCGVTLGPFKVVGGDARPSSCPNCNDKRFTINTHKTQYGNYQKLTLQETPGTVPAGRVPRYKDVILLGDLIDVARPGEEVEITGIYSHTQQISRKSNGFPVFTTIIEANCVQKKQGGSSAMWTNEEKRKIKDLANDPQIGERIIRSIAPSIYGHRHVKTALALSLFGGCQKDGAGVGMHRVRGDVNVLLLGKFTTSPFTATNHYIDLIISQVIQAPLSLNF
jgi:DNA replication licensing factor MCM2